MKRILAVVLATSFPMIAIAAQPAAPQAVAAPAPAAVAAPAAPAFPPPSQASLNRLVDVARVSLIHDSIVKTLDQSAERVDMYANFQLHGITLTPAEKASVASLPAQVKAVIHAEFSTDAVKDIFAKEYAAKFDQKEVDGLIAFYSSPVGQEFAAKQLEINTEVTLELQKAIGLLRVQVQKTVTGVVNPILQAHAPKVAPKPTTAPGQAKPASSVIIPATAPTRTPASTAASH